MPGDFRSYQNLKTKILFPAYYMIQNKDYVKISLLIIYTIVAASH